MRTRAHTRSSVHRGRSCARPAQLARARRADGDGPGAEAHGQAVGASGQDAEIRQVRTAAAAAAHAPAASPCAAASSPSTLRTPSALRAPGLTLGPAPTLLHGERRRARERHSRRGDQPHAVPTHLADPWRSCRSKEIWPAASSSGGGSACHRVCCGEPVRAAVVRKGAGADVVRAEFRILKQEPQTGPLSTRRRKAPRGRATAVPASRAITMTMLLSFTTAFAPPLPTAIPTTRRIAPGVQMPYLNCGGVHSHPSNYTAWLEVGGRGLDTAMMYGDDVQLHVGDAIAASDLPREQLFITSKVPFVPSPCYPKCMYAHALRRVPYSSRCPNPARCRAARPVASARGVRARGSSTPLRTARSTCACSASSRST